MKKIATKKAIAIRTPNYRISEERNEDGELEVYRNGKVVYLAESYADANSYIKKEKDTDSAAWEDARDAERENPGYY
jgi:L-lactate utilization protein LutB